MNAYTSTSKPKSFELRLNYFVYPGPMYLMFMCVHQRYAASSLSIRLFPKFYRGC